MLLISPFFYPHIGGSQRYMEELYAHLVKLYPHVDVTILAYNTNNAPSIERYRGMTIYRIPCWHILPGQFTLPNIFSLMSILMKLSTKHIDYIHTHLRFFDSVWWAWTFARSIKAKSIVTEHVANHPIHEHDGVSAIAKWIDKTIGAWSLSKYDLITTTNTPAKTFLSEELHIKKPIFISYGGVNTTYFSPKKRKQLFSIPHYNRKLSNKTIIITYVGRIIWSKGVTYLIKAIKDLDPILPKHIKFVIAGSGELDNWLTKTIEKDGLKNRIYQTGPHTMEEVRNLLRVTDISIYPSHHTEGFPNTVLESAAAGCFTIATDNAGTTEIITQEKEGLIIPQKSVSSIKQSILWALEHTDQKNKMTREARKKMQKQYDWKTIATSFHTLVQKECLFDGGK